MPDTRAEDAELLGSNIMREVGMKFKGPDSEEKAPDMRAVKPHYKGAELSDMARALMRTKDPKSRRTPEEMRKRWRVRYSQPCTAASWPFHDAWTAAFRSALRARTPGRVTQADIATSGPPWDYYVLDSSGYVCASMGKLHPDNIAIFARKCPMMPHY